MEFGGCWVEGLEVDGAVDGGCGLDERIAQCEEER